MQFCTTNLALYLDLKVEIKGYDSNRDYSDLSDEKQASCRNKLIEDALKLIKERAQIVAKSINKRTIKFAEIKIDSGGSIFGNNYKSDYKMMTKSSISSFSAPILESSTKDVSVTLTVDMLLI